ncbi:MAG: ATP-binding protein [Propionibacteriaceae bacterium]
MEDLHVGVEQAHLQSLAMAPKTALAEIIWNSIDADASTITCTVAPNALDGVDRLIVEDDGTGIAPDDLKQTFGALGYSWKRLQALTDGGRFIHGKRGKGRWAPLGIGADVRWNSVADSVADGRVRFQISASAGSLADFRVSDVEPAQGAATGCKVEIFNVLPRGARYLDSDVIDDLLSTFALQIEQYNLRITWRGQAVDVDAIKESQTDIELQVDGVDEPIVLTVVEWKKELPRHLNLCDAGGATLHQMKPGIHAPGHSFTAYLKWEGFVAEQSTLSFEDQAPDPIPAVIAAGQDALRKLFAEADEARSARYINSWVDEGTYPYKEQPKTQSEVAARGIFDIVAVAAAPVMSKSETEARRLSLELLKNAVETDPSRVRRIMEEVLKLPPEQVESFSDLLDKTSLESLVRAGTAIVGRLEFLTALEEIVNDRELKKHIKERSQLHKLVAANTWIFREEYALTANDNTLKTALRAHLDLLAVDGEKPSDLDTPVLDADGREIVVDLMLSGAIEQQRNHREHLVIELKRPTVSIGKAQMDQIENYARTVAGDTRFASVDTIWEFWIVGDEIDPKVLYKFGQGTLPPDVFSEFRENGYSISIHGVTWAQIIQNARHRLRFVKDQLGYDPISEASLDTLRKRHGEVLPTILLPNAAGVSEQAAAIT